MALQYLEALKALGASPSTKFVIPAEVTRWIEPFAGYVERTGRHRPKAEPQARRPDGASPGVRLACI